MSSLYLNNVEKSGSELFLWLALIFAWPAAGADGQIQHQPIGQTLRPRRDRCAVRWRRVASEGGVTQKGGAFEHRS